MIGAPALAANAALRSGAGLVTVACPASIQQAVATLCPCATSIPLPEDAQGMISPAKALKLLDGLGLLDGEAAPTVVAAGPGLGLGGAAFKRAWVKLLVAFTCRAGVPAVIDADGLNNIAPLGGEEASAGTNRLCKTVLTPHPGEMAQLLGMTSTEVQRARQQVVVDTARLMSSNCGTHQEEDRAVVVLKGAGTLVGEGVRLYVNKTGNPGMATGGSGDVLTGVIAALIGQGMSRFDAAVLGVHVHGLAGDLAAKAMGQISLTASDLINYLPNAFWA